MNNEKLTTVSIPTTSTVTQIENLMLKPDVNIVTLDADEITTVQLGSHKLTLSFKVEAISITN